MARIRTVKPELFRHGGLYDLECETGLPIRLAFIGLFTSCDRNGRFKWKPRELKLDCLPHDNLEFSRVLDALLSRGFILKYENSGVVYGCIPTFTVHQVINNKEKPTDAPCPYEEGSQVFDFNNYSTREPRDDNATLTPLNPEQGERKGKEGKGREEEGNSHASEPDGVVDVFSHWALVMDHQKAILDDKRKSLIKKALKLGYTVNDLKDCITGYSMSPFHMGNNENSTKYDGLDLILRDGSKIDAGLAFFANPPRQRLSNQQNTIDDFDAHVAGVVERTMHLIEDYPE